MRAALLVVTLLISVAGPAGTAQAVDSRAEIVGGVQAGSHEFPWVVRLSNGCSGTLVRQQMVLTAAHCVKRTGKTSSITVTAGTSDLSSSRGVDVRSVAVERASGFRGVTDGRDWAVIKLAKAVDAPVVSLPSGSGLDGGTFTVVGWGSTSEGSLSQQRHLRKVQVPAVSDSKCQDIYSDEGYNYVGSDMICAGELSRGGKDSCLGDSGGPLLKRHESRWVQVGIVSWGVGCGRAGFPGVYTQVSHFIGDIENALKIDESALAN